MKKKLLLLATLLAIMAVPRNVLAYDFSAAAPSGQTLYYNIMNGHAEVVRNGSFINNSNYVSGDLIIPSSVTYNGHTYAVTTIAEQAFEYCMTLTSVIIPSSVTSIGSYAFFNDYGLASVTIPNSVTSIGSGAFHWVRHVEYHGSATGAPWGAHTMNGVREGDLIYTDATKHYLLAYIGLGGSVTIPSSVETIGQWSFGNCTSLTSVTIPNSVTTIETYAFYNCSGLTSVTIGNSVTSIGSSTFYNCTGLTSVIIPSSIVPAYNNEVESVFPQRERRRVLISLVNSGNATIQTLPLISIVI